MKKTLTFCFCVLAISAFSQPVIEWQRVFGGSNRDLGSEIQPTEDGGYIVAGITYSSNSGDVGSTQGDGDCWVVKIDAVGMIEWQRTLGGSDTDWARAIQQTTDGGYILGGQTESDDGDVSGNHGNEDFWIVKLSATGAIEWQKALGGTGNDYFGSVRQTTDGGYFVFGTAGSSNGNVSGNHGLTDLWAIKLNAAGAIQWQKAFGGSNFDGGSDAVQTSDGGFVLAGSTSSIDGDLSFSLGETDAWIVKLTAEGATEWSYTFGGNKEDVPASIIQTNDGGYIVASKHESAWETLIFHCLVPHPSFALKQELMWIPVMNLYFKRMGTVSIRRGSGASAIKSLIQGAQRVMAEKRPLVIFPEGTRAASGRPGKYQAGVAALYRNLNVPVIPVALNSGLFWGRRSPIKHSGKITLKFLPPILPGLSRADFMAQMVDSIEGACAQLNKEAT